VRPAEGAPSVVFVSPILSARRDTLGHRPQPASGSGVTGTARGDRSGEDHRKEDQQRASTLPRCSCLRCRLPRQLRIGEYGEIRLCNVYTSSKWRAWREESAPALIRRPLTSAQQRFTASSSNGEGPPISSVVFAVSQMPCARLRSHGLDRRARPGPSKPGRAP
jgi:hypothetical protein